MTPPEIKTEPVNHNGSSQICRLCMSEESLDDVFKDEHLEGWIWEFLAIKISGDDRMSQVVCTICRIRLAEFHQFRMGCHEVQEVLQALIPDGTGGAQSVTDPNATNQFQRIEYVDDFGIRCEVCRMVFLDEKHLTDHKRDHETENFKSSTCEKSFEPREYLCNHIPIHTTTGSEKTRYTQVKTEIDDNVEIQVATTRSTFPTEREVSVCGILPESYNVDHGPKEDIICEDSCDKKGNPSHCQDGGMENDLLDIKDCIIEAIVEENESDESSHKLFGGEKASDKSDSVNASDENQEVGKDSGKVYQCDLCPKVFYNSTKLTRHKNYHRQKLMKQTAPDEVNEANTEKKDSEQTDTAGNVENETNKDQEYQCDVCQKMCLTKKALRVHKRVVHGPKNHRCDICDVQYTLRSEMTRHVYTKKHLNNVREKQILETEKSSNEDRATGGKNNKNNKDSNMLQDEMFAKYQPFHSNKKYDGKPAKCNVCDRMFPNRWDLANHKKYHKPKKYVCHVCEKSWHSTTSLKKHLLSHVPIVARQIAKPPRDIENAPRPFKCDICQTAFMEKTALWDHNKTVHGPRIFECDICGFKFTVKHKLLKHLQKHASRGHTKEDFQALKKLSQQIDKSMNQSNDASDHSSVPSENETNDNDNAHEGPVADQPFQCNVCNKSFENAVLLYRHNRLVHKPKRFQCSVCRKRYAFRKQLNMHMKIHKLNSSESTAAKDFECPECHKIYSSWKSLYQHVRDHHVRNKTIPDQTFSCTKCDKKFHTEQRLDVHMRTVHTSAEHKCDICKKTFPIRVQLWQHMTKKHGKTTPSPASDDTTDESDFEDSVQNSNETSSEQPQSERNKTEQNV